LVSIADIVIESYRPGVMERLGLGPEVLLEVNPSLVYGRLTGWSSNGPYAQKAGHDINYLAVSGFLGVMGGRDSVPYPPLNLIADMGGGAFPLIMGVLAGLNRAKSCGEGSVVEANMVDGVAMMASAVLRSLDIGQWVPKRESNVLDGGAPFYRCYRCRDGQFVAVGAIEEKFFTDLLSLLDLVAAEIPDRGQRGNWGEIAVIFEERFLTRTRDEWIDSIGDLDPCVSPVVSLGELETNPQLVAQKTYRRINDRLFAKPIPTFVNEDPHYSFQVPTPGESSDAILSEIGISGAQIALLRKQGVLG
jgi:alpha-methylacyl-CoA racemase